MRSYFIFHSFFFFNPDFLFFFSPERLWTEDKSVSEHIHEYLKQHHGGLYQEDLGAVVFKDTTTKFEVFFFRLSSFFQELASHFF